MLRSVGRVWLTGAASAQDLVLQAGDALPVDVGQHVVLESWALPGRAMLMRPCSFSGTRGRTATPPPHAPPETGSWTWCCPCRTGASVGGRWAGRRRSCIPGHGSGGRLGAGLAGFALGRVMATTAAPGERRFA